MNRPGSVPTVAWLSIGAVALAGWYGYRHTGLGVDLWNALTLCSGSLLR